MWWVTLHYCVKTQWSFLLSGMKTGHFPFSWTLCHWMEVFAIDQPTYLIWRETKLAWKGDDGGWKNAWEGVLNWLSKASFVVVVFNNGLYNSYLRITELEVILHWICFITLTVVWLSCFTISVISHHTLSSTAWVKSFSNAADCIIWCSFYLYYIALCISSPLPIIDW